MEDVKKPYTTLRDGELKITIWENALPSGDMVLTLVPERSYIDKNKEWKTTPGSKHNNCLAWARLWQKAYDVGLEYKENKKGTA